MTSELIDKAKNARERAVAALDERDDLHAAMLREICSGVPSADGYLGVMGAFFDQAGRMQTAEQRREEQ